MTVVYDLAMTRTFMRGLTFALCAMVVASSAFAAGQGRDILLDNGAGAPVLWEMNGPAVSSATYLGVNMPTGWKIAGVGDFDGNGAADVLWTPSVPNGPGIIWLTNSDGSISPVALPSDIRMTQTIWIGDFNGDGKSDILLDNGSNAPILLTMNGGSVASATYLGANMPPGYKIAAVGDFDGNGSADVLWTTAAVGGPGVIWLTAGGKISSIGVLPAAVHMPAQVWTGDFNGDGKSDILLDNGSNAPILLTMNGSTVAGEAVRHSLDRSLSPTHDRRRAT